MILTNENYFSKEAQEKYMGSSQFKTFMDCEERALAEIEGIYTREQSVSLLVGSFVDAHFEGTLDIFGAKTPQIFTQKGTLRSEYQYAEYIIQRIERDEYFMRHLSGRKQVIMTADIENVPFKIKIDVYHEDKAIIDLKIMKDFDNVWVKGAGSLPFVEAWGYDIQGAIYQEVERKNKNRDKALPFIIAGATKEKPEPNIAIGYIPQENLQTCLDIVKENVHKFANLKKGIGTPKRCEECPYCRQTKKLSFLINFMEEYHE